MKSEDTIVALATPAGRSGLGVVRLSGDRAVEIATELIRFAELPLETRRATLGTFSDPQSGRALDQVVVTCFRQPHSYTAEDVVEISCHGAPVILKFLVECCLERGARAAEPGEFTMRAFLNRRIDLTQAEAIRDLIESRTLYQARVAAQQMGGAVSARLKPHKKVLMDLIARLEAGIDFAEDDVAVMDWDEILPRIDAIRADLGKLVEGYEYGRIVREGLTLAIVGRPNVGKSSLFNRLLNEDRAIVTATPGTTRDLVAESASVGGIPLRFVDTAGIRETADEVEKLGVERSFQAIADSDLRLLVADASEPWTDEDTRLLAKVRPLGPLLIACNKSDLPAQLAEAEVEGLVSDETSEAVPLSGIVWTSALTGEGLPQLKEKILVLAAPARETEGEGEFLTNLRHQQLIKNSLASLARAREATARHTPHEMVLIDLYEALHALDTLTGATTTDDLLDIVFSRFCVGK
ncbi:MAG: tRNA uridine-5-carboxymethylaminomethyl(34) synthesis GTPase MnmE [Acidobacteria bacterium]|nr:tRNA uridine-5-carboxymethylaminomethyl(34) synthesis GTPase MnmE [Acidobacteriota bacterium]